MFKNQKGVKLLIFKVSLIIQTQIPVICEDINLCH